MLFFSEYVFLCFNVNGNIIGLHGEASAAHGFSGVEITPVAFGEIYVAGFFARDHRADDHVTAENIFVVDGVGFFIIGVITDEGADGRYALVAVFVKGASEVGKQFFAQLQGFTRFLFTAERKPRSLFAIEGVYQAVR